MFQKRKKEEKIVCGVLQVIKASRKVFVLCLQIPQLFLNYSDISSAVGVDPYEENEHVSSWQPYKTKKNTKKIIKFIDRNASKTLSFEKYKKFLDHENFSFIPPEIKINKNNKKKEFRKIKIDAHELTKLNKKMLPLKLGGFK